jgi:transcriptional regulator with XRE-family HTH domain
VCTCTACGDAPGSRTGTPALPFCNLKLKSPKPLTRAYPTELRSIGDHVRKRRLDLGLSQRQVALRIGIDKTSVFNWETGTASPNLRALPGVLRFLGYDPNETGSTLGERLRAARKARGRSIDELAAEWSVDPTTIWKWEKGRTTPPVRYWPRLESFIGRDTALTGGSFPNRLRAIRRRLGLTQKELGRRLRVPQQVVSGWEQGFTQPGHEQARRIEGLRIETERAHP